LSDKIRLAALEATLASHQKDVAQSEVPVIQMLSLTSEELRQRAQSIVDGLSASEVQVELLDGESALGGGAGPTSTFPTTLIGLSHQRKSAQDLEHQLRNSSPPIISRISEGKVLLDLRTVFEDQLPVILAALKNL
jgi:L-seryl-tRNA(Ser) seleniumtransferase